MDWLNYNQFYYFWIIAQELSVTGASKKLRLSQSNLSEQLKQLEENLGQKLFERKARKLSLTESGRMAFDYANEIFLNGQEMIHFFRDRPVQKEKTVIRVGAISSLSKNLQFEFVAPILNDPKIKLIMIEGDLSDLIRQLQNHTLDVVISNMPVRTDSTPEVFNHKLAEIPISLVGTKVFKNLKNSFPKSLENQKIFLPSSAGRFRNDFEAILEREAISYELKAEIEDMALLRLFALSGLGVALVPDIVVSRELESGELLRIKKMSGLSETFYAVTVTRKFPNPVIEKIVKTFLQKNNL